MVQYGYSQDNGKTWQSKKDKNSQFKIGHQLWDKGKWYVDATLVAPSGNAPTPTPTPAPGPVTPAPSLGRVAIVNASNESDADVQKWAAAIKKQCDSDISKYWTYTIDVDFVAKGQTIPQSDFYFGILNNSDESGVLGWHDYIDDKPVVKIFSSECKKYNVPVASCMSHEAAEMIGDEDCNTTVKGFDEKGKPCLYFRENCDPVEDDQFGYSIDGVRVSDFITPQWFVANGFKPLDFTGKCDKSYQILSGGYMLISYDNGQSWNQVDKFESGNKAHKFWEQSHKSHQGRWDIYKKVFAGEKLKACEIKPGKDKAGGKLLSQLKK